MNKKTIITVASFIFVGALVIAILLMRKSENNSGQNSVDDVQVSPTTAYFDKNEDKKEILTFQGITFEGVGRISEGIKQFATETVTREVQNNGLTTTDFTILPKNSDTEEQKTLPTEEEIFAFVNPPIILNTLREQQEIMIEQGLLRGNQRSTLNSNEEIIKYFTNIAEIYIQFAAVTPEKAKDIRRAVKEDLPKIMESERQRYLNTKEQANDSFLEKFYTLKERLQPQPTMSTFVSLFVPVADAAWVSFPLCYKAEGPEGPGYAAISTCCNCGAIPPVPVIVPDCGPEGASCSLPLGCLNLICKSSKNAIWDPVSLICGCG